jgi:hypothetical protein
MLRRQKLENKQKHLVTGLRVPAPQIEFSFTEGDPIMDHTPQTVDQVRASSHGFL